MGTRGAGETLRHARGPASGPREANRLLRAIEELRELEREKRTTVPSTPPFHDLQRRVEAKAREVFRIAGEDPDPPERRTSH